MSGLEAILPIVSAVAGLVGTVVSVAGAIGQSQSQGQQYDYNAQVAEANAQAARQSAAFEEERTRERARRLQGSQRAAYAKAGVQMVGSPLEVLDETAIEAELDAQAIRYGGAVRAGQELSQAEIDRRRGREARGGGYVSAGATILTGVSQFAKAAGSLDTAPAQPQAAPRYGPYGRIYR
jgi:hypothetical protein